jgi:hypothetical protein
MHRSVTAFVLGSVLLIGGARADERPTTPGELRVSMRHVWDDQLVFTRNVIISTLAMDPDQGPVTDYFVAHHAAIARALAPYYGDAATQQLASLLRAHALITTDLVRTIPEGELDQIVRQRVRWVGNVKEIAAHLATLNPRWDRVQLEASLQRYLELTMAQIAQRSIRNWDTELAAYERVRAHTFRFADTLSNGIIAQQPEKFR